MTQHHDTSSSRPRPASWRQQARHRDAIVYGLLFYVVVLPFIAPAAGLALAAASGGSAILLLRLVIKYYFRSSACCAHGDDDCPTPQAKIGTPPAATDLSQVSDSKADPCQCPRCVADEDGPELGKL